MIFLLATFLLKLLTNELGAGHFTQHRHKGNMKKCTRMNKIRLIQCYSLSRATGGQHASIEYIFLLYLRKQNLKSGI